ncbi:MAG: hypothetical protein ACFFDN_09770, partial [Candidatus Hodarchaeota archaeon]
YAQRISSAGNVLWMTNGKAICTETGDQRYPQICSDGTGGAIITWDDQRPPTPDIYAQKINATGSIQWTANGTVICSASGNQWSPQLISDGSGGAIITWGPDYRAGIEIYAQRIRDNGSIDSRWTANGEVICSLSGSTPQICSDGSGGAIITWFDNRPDPSSPDIYAQRINEAGNIQWTVNGEAICTASLFQEDQQIIPDGAGGAFITWMDKRKGDLNRDIYVQKIDSTGNIYWGNGTPGDFNGMPICLGNGQQNKPKICSDGSGGAIIVWRDERAAFAEYDLYAQKINSMGNIQWKANGTAICTASDNQQEAQICSDGSGDWIIIWQDRRSGEFDIYAYRMVPNFALLLLVMAMLMGVGEVPGLNTETWLIIGAVGGVGVIVLVTARAAKKKGKK